MDLGGSEWIWVDLVVSGVDLGGSGADLGWIWVHLGLIWGGSGVYLPVGNCIQPRRSSCGRRGSRAVRSYPIGWIWVDLGLIWVDRRWI